MAERAGHFCYLCLSLQWASRGADPPPKPGILFAFSHHGCSQRLCVTRMRGMKLGVSRGDKDKVELEKQSCCITACPRGEITPQQRQAPERSGRTEVTK